MKMQGTFCEQTLVSKKKFHRKSFRWVYRSGNWILIGCPKGSWNSKRKRCRVGTRAQKILVRAKGKSCPVGKRIRKG